MSAAPRQIRLPIRAIAEAVGVHYDVHYLDLISARRTAKLTRPRHVAYWAARQWTARSLPEIGRILGGRDHTTILHGVQRIERERATDPALQAELAAIELALVALERTPLSEAVLRDLDAQAIARRVLQEARGVTGISVEEIMTLASHVIAPASPPPPPLAPEPPLVMPARLAALEHLADAVEEFLGLTSVLAGARGEEDRYLAREAQIDAFGALRKAFADLSQQLETEHV